jgi:hypothetical protein
MPKPICVDCELFFQPKKNGITWEQMDKDMAGKDWLPFAMWDADLWGCKGCGHEIIVGHAKSGRKRQGDTAEYDRIAAIADYILLSVKDY